jgi:hypothetical protein
MSGTEDTERAAHAKQPKRRPWQTLLAWALILTVAVCLVEVVLIILAGGPSGGFLHIRHPLPRLLIAAGAWLAWHFLRHPRGDWARLGGRAVLLVLGTGASWLAAETGLRVYLSAMQRANSIEHLGRASALEPARREIRSVQPVAALIQRSDDPFLIYELKPALNTNFCADASHHMVVRTNRLGMRRDGEPAAARAPGSVRIIGVGDSGMFGWGVDQGQDYLAVLESNLMQRTSGVLYEALNWAVPGYNTQLEVECVRRKAIPLRPDVVVVGWCENDFQLPIFVPQKGQWTRTDVSLLWYLFFDRKKFADVALTSIGDEHAVRKDRIPGRFEEGVNVEGVRRAFQELKDLSAQAHFQVLVFGPMRVEVVTILRQVGLPYFNTLDRIADDAYPRAYRVHFMHPGVGGHRVLAEHLERELQAQGWLTPKAPTEIRGRGGAKAGLREELGHA